jgi:hypothetical protein
MNPIHLINERGLKSMVVLFPLSPVSSFLVFIIIRFCHVVNLSEFLDDGKNVPAFTLQQGYGQHYKTPSHTPRVLTQNHRDMTIENIITSPHLKKRLLGGS